MEYEDLRYWYENLGRPTGYGLNKKECRRFKEEVIKATSWLDGKGEIKFQLRLECVIDDVTDFPKCKACDNRVNKVRKNKFNDYCSKKCFGVGSNDNRQKTFEENGGHPMHREECRNAVSDKLKNGEASKRYRKERKLSHEERLNSVGKEFRIPKKDFKGNEFYNQMEWFGGFHPNTLTSGGKSSISWLRKGLDSKGKSPEKIKKKWDEFIRVWNVKNKTGLHHNQSHYTDAMISILDSKDILEDMYKSSEFSIKKMVELTGISATTILRRMHYFGITIINSVGSSSYESELSDIIQSYGFEVIKNSRSVLDSRKEIDIYIPSHKIAIEINGLYWHSSKFVTRMYHQEKSLESKAQGIQLIHVWEDDWTDEVKRDRLIDLIRFKLGVAGDRCYARKTNLMKSTYADVKGFYEHNHLQGPKGASRHYSLHHNGEMVAAMSLSPTNGGEWDIVRFATKGHIVGGFSKLLKRFIDEESPSSIISYASIDYSNGRVYESNGFELESITVPGLWYVKSLKRFSRQKFMKHKLPRVLDTYNCSLTTTQNMENNGYLKLYDAGNYKYRLDLK